MEGAAGLSVWDAAAADENPPVDEAVEHPCPYNNNNNNSNSKAVAEGARHVIVYALIYH